LNCDYHYQQQQTTIRADNKRATSRHIIMHFSFKSLAAIITAANSIHGGTAQLQFTDESAEDFLFNHFRSDDDLAASNIQFRKIVASSHECLKHFTNGHELGTHNDMPLVLDSGLILSSGNPYDFISRGGGGDSSGSSTDWHGEGDYELMDHLQRANPYVYTMDACKVQFEIRCKGNSKQRARLSFNYMFGSEEYYEYDNSPYADSFAFFLDGENMAKLPDGVTNVSIDTVNSNVSKEYFIANDMSDSMEMQYPQIEADGFTTLFTAEGNLDFNEWIPMKIVIADVGDRFIDSWILIEGGSLSCVDDVGPSKVPTSKPTTMKSSTALPTVQRIPNSPVSHLLFG